jgi:hypothetical protein
MPDLRRCASALVLFGAMGDLGHKKNFPTLYHMVQHGHQEVPSLHSCPFSVSGTFVFCRFSKISLENSK